MFCENCGKEIKDTWVKCPYCGTEVTKEEEIKENGREDEPKTQPIAGTENVNVPQKDSDSFNAANGNKNKKGGCFTRIVKTLIKIIVVFLVIIGPFTGTEFGTTRDYVLEVIRYYISLLLIFVPLFTLICNTKGIRDKLPLFKKHKLIFTILGSFIVYILIGIVGIIAYDIIDSLHTEQYNQEYLADLEAKAKIAEQEKEKQEEADKLKKVEEKDKKVAETSDKTEKDVNKNTEKETKKETAPKKDTKTKSEKETENQDKKDKQKVNIDQYADSLVYTFAGDAWKYAESNNIEMFNFVERKDILEFTREANMTAMSGQQVYVEESTGWFSDIPNYKRTLDETEFCYVGNLNSDNEPEGLGMLLKYNENYDTLVLKYVGYFKGGMFDGYGLKSEALDEVFGYGSEYLDGIGFYEGYFKEGEKCGKGMEFNQMIDAPDKYYVAVGEYDEDVWNGEIKEYHSGKLAYVGETKDGVYDGKGIQYNYQTGQVRYEGNFKNGTYDGKGTLYDENGDIKYEGEFQMGDVK